MTEADIALRRDSPTDVLPARIRMETPSHPRGLVVVSGQVTARAFRAWMASNELPQTAVAVTTLEELSGDLLRSAGRPSQVMDRPWRHAVADRFLARNNDVGWTTEQAVTDLQKYLRLTDAGAGHDELSELATSLDAPYDAAVTPELLSNCARLAATLEAEAPPDAYPSRAHLVSTARECLATGWDKVYPSVEWVSFATISRLDNPTLRFLCGMATANAVPQVEFHAGIGTADRFAARLQAAASLKGFSFADPDDKPSWAPFRAALGEVVDAECNSVDLQKVAVPDDRREMAYVLQRGGELEALGRSAGDVLAVAPDAGDYRVDAEDFAHRYNIPTDVESRFPLAHQPVTRAVRSVLGLLGAPPDESVSLDTVLRPLRLGLRLTGGWSPVEDAILANLQEDWADEEAHPVDEWLTRLSTASDKRVAQYARVLQQWRARQPDANAVTWLNSLVENFPRSPTVDTTAITPATVDRTRQAAGTDVEPSDRTEDELRRAITTARRLAVQLKEGTDWGMLGDLFLEAVAGSGGGRSLDDADAVRLVDSGNAYFRQAPEVVIVGLSEERFPGGADPAGSFPRSFREAVRESDDPFCVLDTRLSIVERARDQFGAAVAAATERLTFLRPTHDSSGRPLNESRFTRGLTLPDERVVTVGADRHPVDGFTETPLWQRRGPDTYGQRLRTVSLYSSPSNAGQQWGDTDTDVHELDARLSEIAATLPADLVARATDATDRFGDVLSDFQAARADWDAETKIDLPGDLDTRRPAATVLETVGDGEETPSAEESVGAD